MVRQDSLARARGVDTKSVETELDPGQKLPLGMTVDSFMSVGEKRATK